MPVIGTPDYYKNKKRHRTKFRLRLAKLQIVPNGAFDYNYLGNGWIGFLYDQVAYVKNCRSKQIYVVV